MLSQYTERCLERFLRYVKIDTQSDPDSESYPSTEKQWDLLRLLKEELESLGASEVELDSYGYLTASLASNIEGEASVVGFISHVDTSPEISGENVKPIVHRNYDGRDLVLPDKEGTVIRLSEHPMLEEQMGNDIITASGLTLLGADDKAGIAAIMTACEYLIEHPEIKHGKVRIGFTPDEEIGSGTKYFSVEKFGARYAYTIDSSARGQLDTETFSADAMDFEFEGFNTHPGSAKDKMVNALKVASDFICRLPKSLSPEHTEGREGFVHPIDMECSVDRAKVQFILRGFSEDVLVKERELLMKLAEEAVSAYPGSKFNASHKVQYRNMHEVLVHHPVVADVARESIREAGLVLREEAVRGGTDGSQLSFKGLPTPNIFTGSHQFHSRYEWVSLQDMVKSAEVIVRIVEKFARIGGK